MPKINRDLVKNVVIDKLPGMKDLYGQSQLIIAIIKENYAFEMGAISDKYTLPLSPTCCVPPDVPSPPPVNHENKDDPELEAREIGFPFALPN
jgi:hypothetical protein